MGIEDEYSMRVRKRSWRTILLPVMGFIIAGLSALIAFILSGPIGTRVRDSVSGVTDDNFILVQGAVGFGIFLILLLIFAGIFSIMMPKPTKLVSEKQLERERQAREQEKVEHRRRRRQINREMARQNRERNNQ